MKASGLTVCLMLALAGPSLRAEEDSDTLFRQRVKPLLDTRCVNCHGAEKQKGNLRLDSREAALKGGDLGPSIVPGNPAQSLLVQAVSHAKPDLEMPPKDRLSPVEIGLFERWIKAGAPWPGSLPVTESSTSSAAANAERLGDAWTDPRNPITQLFHGQRLDLWSFRPVTRPAVPNPSPGSGPACATPTRNPIDAFIRARLAAQHLSPSPEADRRTLARRLYLDLTGLPPTPSQLEHFVRDPDPEAYEILVDRLLASPRYGEHQARLWLDVVRYSDSNGFDWDEFRPEAWRFRDYVIRAFNADKPFPQFVREQLAGDELVEGPPQSEAEQDRLIATGYLRVGPQDNSAALFNEQGRARAEWLADLTETTGSAFLGLTLACCRCHDHKFDPLSQADHFRFRAFFQPVQYGDSLALDLSPEQTAIRDQHAKIDAEAKPLIADRDALMSAVKSRLRADRIAKLSEADRRLLEATPPPQTKQDADPAAELRKKVAPSDDDARKAFTNDEKARHKNLSEQIQALNQRKRAFTRGLLATDAPGEPPPTKVHFQGDPAAERNPVPPGFPSALDPNPAEIRRSANAVTTGRRLALAEWIAGQSNPLAPRVFVNRAWQAFFGRGLVRTPNDFGLAGARPTHPELLDWLASEFTASGGSIKRLHRLIVTSSTYRQAAVRPAADASAALAARVDADNTLLWRQNLRRLSAEQLRDAMLYVGGGLRLRDGGPPVWPELPADILQANPAFLDDNAEKTKGWYPSPPDQRAVRSVYLVQKRTVRVPFLETFDLPENSTSCPQRNVSLVAPQALSLLNGTDALEAADTLARTIRREAGEDRRLQIEKAFAQTLQRAPSPGESEASQRFLARASLPELCRALLNLNEFAYID